MMSMMQEPSHREFSFRANSFGRFARKHGISVHAEPVDPLGFIPAEALKESKIFITTLRKGERSFNLEVLFDDYRTVLPSVEDVLENMANQAVVFERIGNRELPAFARYIKKPLEVARAMVEDVRFSVPPFKGFLGPEAYAEFLKISETRGPSME